MYAAGSEHPLKGPSISLIKNLMRGTLEGYTSTEVVQEVLHRYTSIGRRDLAIDIASEIIDAMSPILPVTEDVMNDVVELARKYSEAKTRDLVHLATCVEAGIGKIATPDRDFLGFEEISVYALFDSAR